MGMDMDEPLDRQASNNGPLTGVQQQIAAVAGDNGACLPGSKRELWTMRDRIITVF